MNLLFPFKNISTNTLLEFVDDRDNIKDFILTEKGEYPYDENYFENSVERYKEDLANFENEILQIINTTNQETINYYFNELLHNVIYIQERTTLEDIKRMVYEWNKNSLNSYNEKIEKETEAYFKSDDRKRGHLEEYEDYVFNNIGHLGVYGVGVFPRGLKKVKKVNYNFYCVESKPDLIDEAFCEKYFEFITKIKKPYLDIAKKYLIPHEKGEIKSKLGEIIYSKPVVFVEGEHDITYIIKAAELLGYNEILEKIELRQRGGHSNLDKLWNIYKDNNWETIPQKKLLLYDCDTSITDEETGDIYKRVIATVPGNSISKGIENLFPKELVERAITAKRAFIDVNKTYRIKRGIESETVLQVVNGDEKKNFCDWVCENGSKEDFKNFEIVFNLIKIVL